MIVESSENGENKETLCDGDGGACTDILLSKGCQWAKGGTSTEPI